MQILDSVRVHELPSAAGLILKLASQSSGPARLAAVKAVRQKLRLTPQAMTPGVLDAFRLVVMQHADVALEIVEGVDRQCGSLAATGSPSQVIASMLSLTQSAYTAAVTARVQIPCTICSSYCFGSLPATLQPEQVCLTGLTAAGGPCPADAACL